MSNAVVVGNNSTVIRNKLGLAWSGDQLNWHTPRVYDNGNYNQLVTLVSAGGYYIGTSSSGTVVAGTQLNALGEGPSISGTNGWFSPTSMGTDGSTILIAGLYRNPTTLAETGVVFTNQENNALLLVNQQTLAVDSTNSPSVIISYLGQQRILYQQVWQVPTDNSILYCCRYIPHAPVLPDTDNPGVWIATGRKSNAQGGIWWSLDQVHWTELPLPTEFASRTVFDVIVVNYPDYIKIYFSCWGIILNIDYLTPGVGKWSSSQELTTTYAQPDIMRIAENNRNELVAVASGGIFFSVDGVSWNRFSKPGWQFRGVAWHNDTWIVGSETLMQTNQTWTSKNGTTWTGHTTHVNAQDVVVTP
jgi:hypothetical protein